MFEPLPLTRANVESVLASGPERQGLDFKITCDLNNSKALVEIVKDIAAFAIYGGYLVIGTDEHGAPTGHLLERTAKLFDEATLRPKVEKYVKGLTLHSQSFEFDDGWIAVVCVLPHEDGWAIMDRDGDYQDVQGRPKSAFRAGEVFARHGSSSERWTQQDARAIRAEIRRQESGNARRELSADFAELLAAGNAAQATARGPAGTLTLDLDSDALSAAVVEQLRSQDAIPLKLLIAGAPGRILQEALKNGGDVDGTLDRLLSLAGTLTLLDRDEETAAIIDVLGTVYDRLVDQHGMDRADLHVRPDAFRLKLISRAYALGGLLIRRGKWTLVRHLAAFKPRLHDSDYWTNWLVHADVMSARAGLHDHPEGGYRSTVLFAQEHITALPALRPDLEADDSAILASLCQFGFLACLVAIDTAEQINDAPFLAQFAVFGPAAIDPIVVQVIQEPELRAAVFPRDDPALADALKDIDYNASRMADGFHGWRTYNDNRIRQFVAENTGD